MKYFLQFLVTVAILTMVFGGVEWGCAKMLCAVIGNEVGYYPLLAIAFSFNALVSLIVCGKIWSQES